MRLSINNRLLKYFNLPFSYHLLIRVNSVPVKGRSLEEVCDMLTQPTPDITLTVSTFGVVPEDLASFIAPKV